MASEGRAYFLRAGVCRSGRIAVHAKRRSPNLTHRPVSETRCSASNPKAAHDLAEKPLGTSLADAATRQHTAGQILRTLEGRHLEDKQLESQLYSALRVLPVRVYPPRAWQSIERAVAQSPAAFSHALAPRWHALPPAFRSSAAGRCHLASSDRGRRFKARELNAFAALLFESLPSAAQVAGLPALRLDRFDLHHAHIFLGRETGRLGMLFHAKEYPAFDPEAFPVDLGYCQRGSSLQFDARAMDLRNFVWYDGLLSCLDTGEGSVLHQRLLMDGLQDMRTVLEADFGSPLADIYYLHELQGRKPRERVFVCVPGT